MCIWPIFVIVIYKASGSNGYEKKPENRTHGKDKKW